MPRDIHITDLSTAGAGANKTGVSYKLVGTDGTTVLSSADPPWLGQSDAELFVDQTVSQDAGATQSATTRFTLAGRVTTLAASVISSTRIDLSWTDVAGEGGYEVYDTTSGAPDTSGHTNRLATLAAGSTSYSVTGLSAASTHSYQVLATNTKGQTTRSNEVSATTSASTTAPAAPTGVAATSVAQPVVTWTDNATNEDGYYVHRVASGAAAPTTSATRTSAQLQPNSNTWTDTGAAASTVYDYYVEVYNAAGSTFSAAPGSATTPAAVTYEFRDDMVGTANATLSSRATTWAGGAGVGTWQADPDTAAEPILTGDGYARGSGGASVSRSTTNVSVNGTLRAKVLRKGSSYPGSFAAYLRWVPNDGGTAETRYEAAYNVTNGWWQLRKHVGASFSTLSPDPGNLADAWPVGETRIAEVVPSATGLTLNVYGNDGTTLVGSRTSSDVSVSAAGKLGLAVDASATSGFWVDQLTYQPA